MAGWVKFSFEMKPENSDRIEELARQVGVTKMQIFNNALSLLDWAVEEVKKGRVIASVDEENKKYKKILLPLLGSYAMVERAERKQQEIPTE